MADIFSTSNVCLLAEYFLTFYIRDLLNLFDKHLSSNYQLPFFKALQKSFQTLL